MPILATLTPVLVATFIAYSQSPSVAPVVKAIEAGDVRVALRLLDGVTDVNVEDGALLYSAVMHRQREIIERLFAKGADPNVRYDLLQNGVANRWDSITLLLLRHGADPNRQNPHGGPSPLAEASAQGNLAIMRALIEKGANVNYNDYVGAGTALILAIEENKYDAVQLLLDKGADPSIGAKFHGYPREIAKEKKNRRISDLLMRYASNCKDEPERCK